LARVDLIESSYREVLYVALDETYVLVVVVKEKETDGNGKNYLSSSLVFHMDREVGRCQPAIYWGDSS
jgi:hypothetical protein